MRFKLRPNIKTRFTRKCIAEAILVLLADTPFEKLRVSSIIRKAGISRMTFYKYYDSPKSALTDYLHIIISEYIEQGNTLKINHSFRTYDHILYSINFFDQYADFFLIMARNGLHSILLNGINQFMADHIDTDEEITVYEVYGYAGALLNTFLNWEANEKKDSAQEVARHLYALYGKV